MKKSSFFAGLLLPALLVVAALPASAYTPVPGPNFAGCPGPAGLPLTPIPAWAFNADLATELSNPITWPNAGQYDFCGMADTIYCSLSGLSSLAEEVVEFAGLVQCLYMDINGPVNLEADIPVTPNGIPDGPFELGLIAFVLNSTGHPLHTQTMNAYQGNFLFIRNLVLEALFVATLGKSGDDKDLRPILETIFAPHLLGSLCGMLAGFATMGDAQTNAAMDQLLLLLEDIGLTPPEGGMAANTVGIQQLGPFGDADNDSYSNYAEYQYFVGSQSYNATQYVAAALDPAQMPPTYSPSVSVSTMTGFFVTGDTIALTATLKNYFEAPEYIRWYKDAVLLDGEDALTLEILNAQEADSGTYKVAVGVMVEEGKGAKALVADEVTASIAVNVSDSALPLGGALGLSLLASACALAGAVGIRRRK